MKQKSILSLMLCICLCISAYAQVGTTIKVKDSDGNKLIYEVTSESTVKLIDGTLSKNLSLVIPDVIKDKGINYSVTDFNLHHFQNVKSLSLPNTITELSKERLKWGYNVEKLKLPSKLKKIGPNTFGSWSLLKELEIPNTVTEIGEGCFCYCYSLEKIILPEGVTELGEFKKDGYVYGFFAGCKKLKTIVLPNSVKKLGDQCFSGCEELQSIDIPNSVTELGAACFKDCKRLKRIVLPEKIERLKSRSLHNDSGNYTEYYGCFQNCENLEEVVLPQKLKVIDQNCFQGCGKLRSVIGINGSISLKRFNYKDSSWGPFFGSDYDAILDSLSNTYSFYAEGYVKNEIEEWQKKKEFETTAQYRQRVTQESRNAKVKSLLDKAKQTYLNNSILRIESYNLGKYDADYSMFAIEVGLEKYSNRYRKYFPAGKTTKYVKVASNEAEAFKKNFNPKSVKPLFVIQNNNKLLDRLEVSAGEKRYVSQEASEDYQQDEVALNLPDLELDLGTAAEQRKPAKSTRVTLDKTIDQNIPSVAANNKNCFAVIIGNERYTQVAQVPFANNDARIFAEYCKKTLGLPEKNVKVYENASYGTMIGAVSDIQKIAKAFKGDISVIFYYAGHGIPDEATGDGYLLPIDADGLNMRVCYPLSQLYKELGEMNVRNVTCFMDACFSGAQRGNGMVVAARGVAIKAKADHPMGNTVVFTAATDKQTAYPYEEKGHGMFTYYLLKKLRETKGDCTLGELGSYISDEVAKQAVVTNGKEQTPVVLTSQGITNDWKNLKLR